MGDLNFMAEQVDEDAQYTLSLCYYNEVGVAQDYVQALFGMGS